MADPNHPVAAHGAAAPAKPAQLTPKQKKAALNLEIAQINQQIAELESKRAELRAEIAAVK